MFVSITIVPMLLFGEFFSPFDNVLTKLRVGVAILLFGSMSAPYLVQFKNVDLLSYFN